MPHRPGLALIIALALSLSACKVVKTSDTASKSTTSGGTSDQSDMAARVDGMWDAEIMPHLEKSAAELTGLKAAIASGLDAAGEAHGYRSQAEGSPWNFPVRFVGAIVAAKTDTRAATADLDVDGDITVSVGTLDLNGRMLDFGNAVTDTIAVNSTLELDAGATLRLFTASGAGAVLESRRLGSRRTRHCPGRV